jgi:hypothetical protein
MVPLLFATLISAPSPDIEYRQPCAAAQEKRVAVAFGGTNAIHAVLSNDGGATFGKPVKVSEAGVLALGRHRGPRIAIDRGTIVVSGIVGEKGRGADGDVLAWRSRDGGKTWSGAVRINDVAASAREGLHAMASGGGLIVATWLDLRSKGTKLHGSVSRDGGLSWSKNALIYESPGGSICECCHPSIAVTDSSVIYVMFRNSLEGARDMYLVKSTDRGETFGPAVKLGSGTWMLNACPMDGGGLALGKSGTPETVWRREGEIYAAAPDVSERKIGSGKDASLAVTTRGTYIAWNSPEGNLVLSGPDASKPVTLDREGSYVQLLNVQDNVIALWERRGSIVVEPLNH